MRYGVERYRLSPAFCSVCEKNVDIWNMWLSQCDVLPSVYIGLMFISHLFLLIFTDLVLLWVNCDVNLNNVCFSVIETDIYWFK